MVKGSVSLAIAVQMSPIASVAPSHTVAERSRVLRGAVDGGKRAVRLPGRCAGLGTRCNGLGACDMAVNKAE